MTVWPENTVHVNDIDIHYYSTGDACQPALILLHGVMDNGLGWIPVARDLQQRFALIMPDARGHGQTGGSLEHFSYHELAKDVAGLIRELHLQPSILWGHSMGALTAAVVAASYPELVRMLLLEDPPFLDALPTGENDGAVLQMLQGILSLKMLTPAERLAAARTYNPLWDDIELDPWITSKLEFNPEVFQHLEHTFPWRTLLPRIACPLLLVTGDPSAHAIVTPQIALEACNLLQQGEVVQIAGAGHCIHRDKYKESMAAILPFLSRV
jgi:pimeloyl-ACP methyl ester carboxylesterase